MKCLSYVGAVGALARQGFEFKSISACSAGSLIGALLAAGKTPAELESFVLDLDLRRFAGRTLLNPFALFFWPFARRAKSGLAQAFSERLGTEPTFGALPLPFATIAADLRTRRILVYSTTRTPEMLVSEALEIATTVPLLFPPHERGGRLLVDGAIASQCPLWLPAEYRDELPIVTLAPRRPPTAQRPRNVGEYADWIIGVGSASRDFYLANQMPRVRSLEIDCGQIRYDQVRLSRADKEFLIQAGQDAVTDALRLLGAGLERTTYEPPAATAGLKADDLAERGGAALMTEFTGTLGTQVRNQVFISYSRANADWLKMFQDGLKPVLRGRPVQVWADRQIPPGAKWFDEIRQAMARTKVALLLVTRDYLASDFINSVELAEFLQAAEKEGLRILWVAVSASAFADTPLGRFQAVNDPNAPLNSLTEAERDAAVVAICQQVKDALET